MAAWIATEFWAEFQGQLGIGLTPVDEGRLEILVNGEMLFDRKAEGGDYPEMSKIRALGRTLREKVEAVGVAS